MSRYTVFCRDRTGDGTTWIDSVEAESVDQARSEAVEKCARDWEYFDSAQVVCVGVAEGDVDILFWDDQE